MTQLPYTDPRIVYTVHVRTSMNVALNDVGARIAECLRAGGFETDGVICSAGIVHQALADDCLPKDEPDAEDYDDNVSEYGEDLADFRDAESERWLRDEFKKLDAADVAAEG